jgi:hypothetical protein
MWAFAAAVFVAVGAVAGMALGTPAHHTAAGTSPPRGHLTIVAPTTSTTAPPAPTTTAPPATTTTTAPPVTRAGATTAAAQPGQCGAGDLAASVSTPASSYGPGQAVEIDAVLTVLRSCVFQPSDVPGASCPTTVAVIDDAGGGEVWPGQTHSLQCQSFQSGLVSAGTHFTLTTDWDHSTDSGPCCTLGKRQFQAKTTWSWSSPGGTASTANVSSPFVVS